MIESHRLLIRKMTTNDILLIFQLMNDEGWQKFISSGKKTLEDAKDFIEKTGIQSYEQYGFGYFAVIHKERQIPMGICGLLQRSYLSHVDIGFAFLPPFRGHGYAKEAVIAVIDYAHSIWGISCLQAITKSNNLNSISLLQKVGFHFCENILLPSGEQIELHEVILNNGE